MTVVRFVLEISDLSVLEIAEQLNNTGHVHVHGQMDLGQLFTELNFQTTQKYAPGKLNAIR